MARKRHKQKLGYTPQQTAQKDVHAWANGIDPFTSGTVGVVGRNRNLSNSSWGAATAYQVVHEVNRAMRLRADAVSALDWQIVRGDTDDDETIIASSADSTPRHPLARAFQDTYQYSNQPLTALMCYSDDLQGEIFIQKTYIPTEGRSLKWLNPLGVVPIIGAGNIQAFNYSQLYGGEARTLKPIEVCYYHEYNPFNDFRGQGIAQVVMQKINIARNLDDFIEDFFGNNARPSVLVSPTGDIPLDDLQRKMLQNEMDNFLKGRGNQFSTYISRMPGLNFQPMEQPNIGNQYTIAPVLTHYIFAAFGVPLSMAGDDSGTQYKTGDDVKFAFYQNTIIPLSVHLEQFINAAIMPYFDDSGAFFRFDTSEYDLVSTDDDLRSQIATRNYTAGLWTRNHALTYMKQRELGTQDFLQIDGLPIPLSEVPTYWQNKLLIRPTQVEATANVGGQEVTTQVTGGSPPSGHPPQQLPAVVEGKAVQVDAQEELRAWLKKIRAKNYRTTDFETYRLSHGLTHWLNYVLEKSWGDGAAIRSLFNEAQEWVEDNDQWHDDRLNMLYGVLGAVKDYSDTATAFENSILQTFKAGQSDEISRAKFSGAFRSALRRYGLQAFRDGLQEGGYTSDSLGAAELKAFRDWQDEQSGYVSNLAKEMYSVGMDESAIENRVKMWVNKSLESIRYRGIALAAPDTQYTWHLGKTEQHCATCLANDGKTDTMANWSMKGLPHSDALECGGFLCDCRLTK